MSFHARFACFFDNFAYTFAVDFPHLYDVVYILSLGLQFYFRKPVCCLISIINLIACDLYDINILFCPILPGRSGYGFPFTNYNKMEGTILDK